MYNYTLLLVLGLFAHCPMASALLGPETGNCWSVIPRLLVGLNLNMRSGCFFTLEFCSVGDRRTRPFRLLLSFVAFAVWLWG